LQIVGSVYDRPYKEGLWLILELAPAETYASRHDVEENAAPITVIVNWKAPSK